MDGKFLYYYTLNPTFRAYAAENMSGAAGQKRVSTRFLKDTRLFLPPKHEQERIATFLDNACAFIDEALAAKRRQLEVLDELRRATITHAVTAGLDGSSSDRESATQWFRRAPAHWHIKRLKDVVSKFVDYRGRTPEKTPEGIPLVTARNIRGGKIDFTESQEYIAEEDYDDWMVRGLPKRGDVLITTEAPMGEVAAVEDTDIALAQRIVLLKTNRYMTNEYLTIFLPIGGRFSRDPTICDRVYSVGD